MFPIIEARNIGSSVVRTHRRDEIWETARDPAIWKARYEGFLPCRSWPPKP